MLVFCATKEIEMEYVICATLSTLIVVGIYQQINLVILQRIYNIRTDASDACHIHTYRLNSLHNRSLII